MAHTPKRSEKRNQTNGKPLLEFAGVQDRKAFSMALGVLEDFEQDHECLLAVRAEGDHILVEEMK